MHKLDYLRCVLGGGTRNSQSSFAIDKHSPSGFYYNEDKDCVLVCDDPICRFMITLRHQRFAPFTKIDLGDIPLGQWFFESGLTWRFPSMKDPRNEPEMDIGIVQLEEYVVSLGVRDLAGNFIQQIISYGWGSIELTWNRYNSWKLFGLESEIFSHGQDWTYCEV